ncbi:MAG: hypothetical protein H0X45_01750 [Planctomycetes bacterium]|nr:hypothetical protein [Planctomycetota bacterium]
MTTPIANTIANTNDGTTRAPRLRVDINAGNLFGLPAYTSAPQGDERALLSAAKAAGFEGVQGGNPALCRELGLGFTTGGRVNQPAEAEPHAAQAADAGFACSTLHVGWGHEDDDTIARLVEAILAASQKHRLPIYIETHRATITQDTWRTVQMVNRFPEVRINADFSHWYTGLEMVYGDIEAKFDFLAPVFERVRFVHGRIGDPGCIQRDIGATGEGLTYVDHFKEMWTRSFVGFLKTAKPGDYLSFNPELLQPGIYYARLKRAADGSEIEEGDRWQQAILYGRIARACFAEAQKRVGGTATAR